MMRRQTNLGGFFFNKTIAESAGEETADEETDEEEDDGTALFS
jgi:hypothetical protein